MRKMKDSGVEWIGEIPYEWEMRRLRFLCNITTGNMDTQNNNPDGEYPFYVRSPIVERSDEYTFDNEAVLMAGDGVGAGKVFHYVNGKYGCHQRVYSMSGFQDISGKYLYYYLLENFYKKMEESNAKSTVDSVRLPMLKDFFVVFPNCFEQEAIVQYLDSKCLNIDGIIACQEEIITKIKEYKTSLYSEQIANCLGKEIAFGKVIESVEQGWSPSSSDQKDDNGWSVLTLAAVKYGQFDADETKEFAGDQDKCKRLVLRDGDFLLTRSNTRELVGQVCIVENVKENTIFSDLIYRINFNLEYIDPQYALYYFQSPQMRQQISRDAHGSSSSMVKITHKNISNWTVVLPSIETQKEIVSILKQKEKAILNEIAKRECLIKKLIEYKKSLIYEVVTGKKEVL